MVTKKEMDQALQMLKELRDASYEARESGHKIIYFEVNIEAIIGPQPIPPIPEWLDQFVEELNIPESMVKSSSGSGFDSCKTMIDEIVCFEDKLRKALNGVGGIGDLISDKYPKNSQVKHEFNLEVAK